MNEAKKVEEPDVVELGVATEVTNMDPAGLTPETTQQPPFTRKEE